MITNEKLRVSYSIDRKSHTGTDIFRGGWGDVNLSTIKERVKIDKDELKLIGENNDIECIIFNFNNIYNLETRKALIYILQVVTCDESKLKENIVFLLNSRIVYIRSDAWMSKMTVMVDAITSLLDGKLSSINFTGKIIKMALDHLIKMIDADKNNQHIDYFSYFKLIKALMRNDFLSSDKIGCAGNKKCFYCLFSKFRESPVYFTEKNGDSFISLSDRDKIFSKVKHYTTDDILCSLVNLSLSAKSLEKINKDVMNVVKDSFGKGEIYEIYRGLIKKMENKCRTFEIYDIKFECFKIYSKNCTFRNNGPLLEKLSKNIIQKHEKYGIKYIFEMRDNFFPHGEKNYAIFTKIYSIETTEKIFEKKMIEQMTHKTKMIDEIKISIICYSTELMFALINLLTNVDKIDTYLDKLIESVMPKNSSKSYLTLYVEGITFLLRELNIILNRNIIRIAINLLLKKIDVSDKHVTIKQFSYQLLIEELITKGFNHFKKFDCMRQIVEEITGKSIVESRKLERYETGQRIDNGTNQDSVYFFEDEMCKYNEKDKVCIYDGCLCCGFTTEKKRHSYILPNGYQEIINETFMTLDESEKIFSRVDVEHYRYENLLFCITHLNLSKMSLEKVNEAIMSKPDSFFPTHFDKTGTDLISEQQIKSELLALKTKCLYDDFVTIRRNIQKIIKIKKLLGLENYNESCKKRKSDAVLESESKKEKLD